MKSWKRTALCAGLAAGFLLPTAFAAQNESAQAQQELTQMAGTENEDSLTVARAKAAKVAKTSGTAKAAKVAKTSGTAKAAEPAKEAKAAEPAKTVQTSANAGEPALGLPNPYMTYQSYEDLAKVLGFRPLVMVKSTGFELKEIYAISGQTADLRYESRYGETGRRAAYQVRTERAGEETAEGLSGIHGYTWKTQQIGSTAVQIAELSPSSFAAFWQSGGYAFSVYGENINRWDFLGTLTDNFVDLTTHYYVTAEK